MKTLDEIAIRHGTDKATVFTRTWAKPHGYTVHLESYFEPLRRKPIKLLEIGVGGGESIRTWLEYFQKAKVIGVDLVHSTNEWNTPKAPTHPRYQFCQGNQSCETFWACFIADYGKDWNIVIDDGSHVSSDIITTFKCLWPHVVSGGLYEIEDLSVAHEAAAWVVEPLPLLVSGHTSIASVTLAKELAIIKKS